MKINSPDKRRSGFTLIELMVVIVIVAVLATLSFMGVKMATEKAHLAESMSNMRQLGLGLMAHNDDSGRFPSRNQSWDKAIIPYLNDMGGKSLQGRKALRKSQWPELEKVAELFKSPADKFDRDPDLFQRSYAIVPWTTNWSNGTEFRGWKSRPFNQGVPLSIVNKPSSAAVIVEWYEGNERISNDLGTGRHGYHDMGGREYDKLSLHRGRQIVLFADGHTEIHPLMSRPEFVERFWPGEIGKVD